VNAVARRRNSGGSWVGGGPCLVNAVARRLSGGDSWVGWRSMIGECGS
jgi:hypothetical protein